MASAERLSELARSLVEDLTAADKSVATAESCTGGWIAKAITDVAGSSACFGFGVTSYSNAAKQRLLDVRSSTLDAHGAVSEAVVTEMARGALGISDADFSVAVSGVAGPSGGSPDKPVGTVWFAWASADPAQTAITRRLHLDGDRDAVRSQSVRVALEGLKEMLESHG